jgi:hypothetical protein
MSNRLLVILLTLSSLTAFSQTNHSLQVGGNVGMTSLIYSIESGSCKPKLSYGGHFNYVYYFSPRWGIGTGVAASLCTTDGVLNGTKISFENQIDDENDLHRKDLYFRELHEKQKFLLAEVPVLLHYQYDFGLEKRRKLYVYVGAKVQLPLMASYEVTKGEVETQRYYPEWNATLHGMPNHGMGKEAIKSSGSLSLPLEISASLGIGFSFEVSKIIDIYMGAGFDYGFLNLKSENSGDLLYFDQNGQMQYRGILLSSITQKANLISFQGEIGIRIGVGKSSSYMGIYGKNKPKKH